MKEFISGMNWKWKFFKFEDEYVLPTGDEENEYYFEVIPGVFRKSRVFSINRGFMPKEIIDIDDNLYKKLMDKFFCPLRVIEKSDMIDIALKVLNKRPRLRSMTCMAWTPFEDKSKDPNYYYSSYILPDGSTYTIVLHNGDLSVFPGEVSGTVAVWTRLPLVSRRINLQQLADKIYKDKNTVINFE